LDANPNISTSRCTSRPSTI